MDPPSRRLLRRLLRMRAEIDDSVFEEVEKADNA
jgi:hypothetical protein